MTLTQTNAQLTVFPYEIRKHPTLDIFVRSDGYVLHLDPKVNHRLRGWTKGSKGGRGYYYFGAFGKRYLVHILVAQTFVPNPDDKPTVDHIDRDKLNNSVSNLRWATHKEQTENTSTYNGGHRRPRPTEYFEYKKQYYHEHKEELRAKAKAWVERKRADGYISHRLQNGKREWVKTA